MIQKIKNLIFPANKKKILHGFTLIEGMTLLFVFSVVVLSFYEAWSVGTRYILNAKNRLGATALANQKMEVVRNLDYDFIGTTTGIPSGSLIEDETVSVNTALYQVHTTVVYRDDSQDGTFGAGDTVPTDYKVVRLTVSWGTGSESERIVHVSLFSQDGVESAAANTGVLAINVLDSSGIGVSGATLHIVNASTTPAVNVTTTTDATGHYDIPGTPASGTGYTIDVSKTGYYPISTHAPYPTSSYNPTNVHPIVVAGSLTQSSFVMDQNATIQFRTKDPFDHDIENLDFTITGGQILGTDPVTGAPVYDFTQTTDTNEDGEKNFSNRSYGSYTVTLDPSETGYRFLYMNPHDTSVATVFGVTAGTSQAYRMVLAKKNYSSVLAVVQNVTDGSALANASVHLSSTTLGYDTTVTTDVFGYAFFPTLDTPLAAGTYDIEISATGFTTQTDTVVVTGTGLIEETYQLSP